MEKKESANPRVFKHFKSCVRMVLVLALTSVDCQEFLGLIVKVNKAVRCKVLVPLKNETTRRGCRKWWHILGCIVKTVVSRMLFTFFDE